MINYNKHIWEGWSVLDFINALDSNFNLIMNNKSHIPPFTTKDQLKKWCMENQPYYKKYIPEVVKHFQKKLNIQ